MHLILLSGGSGKRLWPLSNDSRSKQFLKVLSPTGEQATDGPSHYISMVQRVWQQLQETGLSQKTVIATSKSQVDMINSQLGPVPLVIEPTRRDTYPAILLSAVYLYSIKGVSPEEVIAVMPVDPYVENNFFTTVDQLEGVVNESGADLALIGITPTYPSEKYGYIVPREEEGGKSYRRVSHFTEKPNEEKAKELLAKGAFWNGGVFAFKLGFLLDHLQSAGLPIQFDEAMKQYSRFPKNSFDYEVVEKTENIAVLPYNGSWKDLGTWNTLTEEMSVDLIGKGMIGADCENVHIINELDVPVATLGLKDVVVAVSPDGILVSDKEASPRVKEMANHFQQRPMYEERRWGWYRVLDYTRFDGENEVLTKRIGVLAGQNLSYQKHFHRSEVWNIIHGEGLFVLDGVMMKVKAGDILNIPVGACHGIKAVTDLEFIEVQNGRELIEEDIIRIYMTWEEIEKHCLIH